MASWAATALVVVGWLVIAYFVLANLFQTALLVSATAEMVRHRRLAWGEDEGWLLASAVAPTISVLLPAYNEAATVVQSVRALLTLRYPRLEVVVVNDGSTDATLAVLASRFDLRAVHPIYPQVVPTAAVHGLYRSEHQPGLVVVDKDNGGKADSLNAGLNLATGELVCAIDADTILEPDALLRVVRPFLTDPRVVASGATIRVVNGSVMRPGRAVRPRAPRGYLAGVQVVEYLRAFLFGRLGWNRLGGNLIISGAFGLFGRELLRASGGYLAASVAEDMELVVRLRRTGLARAGPARVSFVPDSVAWTEVPGSLRVLGRQRDRWQRGLCEVLWRHHGILFNPRYRAMGLVVAPYFLLIELAGPVVEALGLVAVALALALGALSATFAILFFLAVYGWAVLVSVWAVLLDEITNRRYRGVADRVLLACWAFLENVGYRQLVVFWQLRGLVRFARGRREWGTMGRRGVTVGGPGPSRGLPAGDQRW